MWRDKYIYLSGFIAFIIYVIMLFFRPTISWCDDCFFVDLARQIAIKGKFFSNVWFEYKPNHVPLYPLLLAGWIKLLGFSYFKVHLLDCIFVLFNHIFLLSVLYNNKILKSLWSLIGITFLLWFGATIFWINNAGRPEVLTLGLTMIAVYYLFVSYIEQTLKNLFKLAIASFFVLTSGIQGVVALLFISLILFLLDVKFFWRERKQIFTSIICGLSIAFCFIAYVYFYFGLIKSFLVKTFLYSKTLAYIWRIIKGHPLQIVSSEDSDMASFIIDRFVGLTNNLEWCILLILLLLLYLEGKSTKAISFSVIEKTILVSSVLLPFFFVLSGRYPIYYSGFAYVLVVVSCFVLLERLVWEKYGSFVISVVVIICFIFGPFYIKSPNFRVVDFNNTINQSVLKEINCSSVSFEKPVVIPYRWYYYLIEKHEDKLFFQSSGKYPSDLSYIVSFPSNEYIYPSLMNLAEKNMVSNFNGVYCYKIKNMDKSLVFEK